MQYALGTVRVSQLSMRDRDVNAPGEVIIGGTYGDIRASSARPYDDGVELCETILLARNGLCPAGQIELLQEIVYSCYESIQEETFTPTRRKV